MEGSGCWEGAQGKHQRVERKALIVSECSGAVHFAGEHLQMTNGSDFRGLNVSYNSWLMSPLAVTTAVSIPFDSALFQYRSDNRRLPGAACSAPVPGKQSACAKGSGKVRSVNSAALQRPAHLSFQSLPVWIGFRLAEAQVPRMFECLGA